MRDSSHGEDKQFSKYSDRKDKPICPHPLSDLAEISPRQRNPVRPPPPRPSQRKWQQKERSPRRFKDAGVQTELTTQDIDRLLKLEEDRQATSSTSSLDSSSLIRPRQKVEGRLQPQMDLTLTIPTAARRTDRILLLGGATDYFASKVEEYDILSGCWKDVCDIPADVEWMSAACVARENSVYVIGEIDFEFSKKIGVLWRLDAHQGTWDMLPSITSPRVNLCLVDSYQGLFALGGCFENQAVNVVERFDMQQEVWTSAPSMDKPRSQFGAIFAHEAIFAFGGMTDRLLYRSGERLDPRQASWQKLKKMKSGRTAFGCVCFAECVYLIGGFSSNADLTNSLTTSTEIYELRMEKFRPGPDLTYSRGWCTASVIDSPVVIGGKTSVTGNEPNAPMEILDLSRNEWIVNSATECSGHRAFCSAIHMPNVN